MINKHFDDENLIENFCRENKIKVLEKIPFDSELSAINSEGEIVSRSEKYDDVFSFLLQTVVKEVENEAITHS